MKKNINNDFEKVDVNDIHIGGTFHNTSYADCDGGSGNDIYDDVSGEMFYQPKK